MRILCVCILMIMGACVSFPPQATEADTEPLGIWLQHGGDKQAYFIIMPDRVFTGEKMYITIVDTYRARIAITRPCPSRNHVETSMFWQDDARGTTKNCDGSVTRLNPDLMSLLLDVPAPPEGDLNDTFDVLMFQISRAIVNQTT